MSLPQDRTTSDRAPRPAPAAAEAGGHLIVEGVNHRSCPIEIRERLSFARSRIPQALAELRARLPELREALILSTCNRVEFYLYSTQPSGTEERLTAFLQSHHGIDCPIAPFLYTHCDRGAVRHLFRITCGLDSLVLGETEILGQAKQAYQLAFDEKATGKYLNQLFQKSFQAAKLIRTRTNIGRGSVSVGSVAVELAEKIFGDIAQRQVMLIGAGEISETTAQALHCRGVASVVVSNRSFARAEALAARFGGRAIRFDDWLDELAGADIVISSTSAPHYIVTVEKLAPLMRRRTRPLFLVDIAVPRDVEPQVERLENVYLYNIDHLQALADENRRAREEEIRCCELLIDEKVDRFAEWLVREASLPQGRAPQGAGAASIEGRLGVQEAEG